MGRRRRGVAVLGGLALGVGLGAALSSVAIGVALGVVFAVAFHESARRRDGRD